MPEFSTGPTTSMYIVRTMLPTKEGLGEIGGVGEKGGMALAGKRKRFFTPVEDFS